MFSTAEDQLTRERSTRHLFVGYTTNDEEVWFTMDVDYANQEKDEAPSALRALQNRSYYHSKPKGGDLLEANAIDETRLARGLLKLKDNVTESIELTWMQEYGDWIGQEFKEKIMTEIERVKGAEDEDSEEQVLKVDPKSLDGDQRKFYAVNEPLTSKEEADLEQRVSAHLTRIYGWKSAIPVDIVHEMRLVVKDTNGKWPPWKCGAYQAWLHDTNQQHFTCKWKRDSDSSERADDLKTPKP